MLRTSAIRSAPFSFKRARNNSKARAEWPIVKITRYTRKVADLRKFSTNFVENVSTICQDMPGSNRYYITIFCLRPSVAISKAQWFQPLSKKPDILIWSTVKKTDINKSLYFHHVTYRYFRPADLPEKWALRGTHSQHPPKGLVRVTYCPLPDARVPGSPNQLTDSCIRKRICGYSRYVPWRPIATFEGNGMPEGPLLRPLRLPPQSVSLVRW